MASPAAVVVVQCIFNCIGTYLFLKVDFEAFCVKMGGGAFYFLHLYFLKVSNMARKKNETRFFS